MSYKNFFSWRSALINSDLEATTKHVLLTLSTHFNEHGLGAWPCVATMMKETSLSNRVVILHLKKGISLGWVSRKVHNLADSSWVWDYSLSWPNEVNEVSVVEKERSDVKSFPGDSEMTLMQSEVTLTTERSDSASHNLSINSTKNSNNPPTPLEGEVLPDWINPEAWMGFLEMRNKIRKPLTHRAIHLAIQKLDGFRASGQDPSEVLNQSTMNCWQGLFEVRKNGGGYVNRAEQRTANNIAAGAEALRRASERDYEKAHRLGGGNGRNLDTRAH